MSNQIANTDLISIAHALQSKKSGDRMSACKKINKYVLITLGDALYSAYLKECEDSRSWRTQVEMMLALSKIGYMKVLPALRLILDKNEQYCMITHIAAVCYVRLSRRYPGDASPVIELLKTGNLSILNGAISALFSEELMIPSDEGILTIIEILDTKTDKDYGRARIGLALDPRVLLLSGMETWKRESCMPYIRRLADSPSRFVKEKAVSVLHVLSSLPDSVK